MHLKNLLLGPLTSGMRSVDAGLLISRVVGGLALALAHGLSKVPPSERFVARVADMGFPAPELFAYMAGAAELGGGLLLAVGLLTRPAAAFVAGQMAVVTFIAHAGDPFGSREKAVLFLGIALLHLFAGPGRYSLDALVFGRRPDAGARTPA